MQFPVYITSSFKTYKAKKQNRKIVYQTFFLLNENYIVLRCSNSLFSEIIFIGDIAEQNNGKKM